MEETMFYRGKDVEGDITDGANTPTGAQTPPLVGDAYDEKKIGGVTPTASAVPTESTVIYKRKTYLDKLKLVTVVKERPNELFKMMYRPLMLLQFPVVSWSGFQYGINLCWFNVLNATAALILSGEPYNFKPSFVGLAYVAPMIGVTFAYVPLDYCFLTIFAGVGMQASYQILSVSNLHVATREFESLNIVYGCSWVT